MTRPTGSASDVEPPTRPRPRVTANQVTVARLIPMPLIAWLIYQGEMGQWVAMSIALVVGSTDYLDGYLARKHGPTVLGALLDPLADKVFLAFIFLPLVDLGTLPPWAVALMFTREFLVTAMRSAYAQRGIHFETSYLAKVKTWVQMQGVGTVVVCLLLDRTGALLVLAASVVVPFAAFLAFAVLRGRIFRNLWVGSAFTALQLAVYIVSDLTGDMRYFTGGVTWILVALTWVSGLDYLVGGLPRLRRAGGFGRADGARVIAAGALPLVAVAALVETPAPAAAIMAVFAFELAVGGLDNLLSLHHRAPHPLVWGARAFGTVALLAATLVVPAGAVAPVALAAAVLSGVGAAIEFWRGRDVYL